MRGQRQTEPPSLISATLVALLGLLAVGPVLVGAQQEDQATVRVIHGVSDSGPIDLYIDGAIAVVAASFPSVTDPLRISGGEHRIVVTASGSTIDNALVDSTLSIDAGTTDEIAVVGSAAGLSAVLFQVDRSTLPDETARLRIVHASPDAGPVDPVLGGAEAQFPTVDFLLATEYAEVSARVYPLTLQVTSGSVEPLEVPELPLNAGTVTDVYIVGQVADGSLQPLLVGSRATGGRRAAQDAPTPTEEPAPATEQASLRAGTCAALEGEVAPISTIDAPTGAEVGPQGGQAIQNGFATVPVAFNAIVGAAHAIVVGGDQPAACGDVGGRLTEDGSLLVPLLAGNGTSRGVAVLFPNVFDPTTTDISVFVVPRAAASESDQSAEAEPAPAATEAAEEPPATVTIAAIGTPEAASEDTPAPGVEEVGG